MSRGKSSSYPNEIEYVACARRFILRRVWLLTLLCILVKSISDIVLLITRLTITRNTLHFLFRDEAPLLDTALLTGIVCLPKRMLTLSSLYMSVLTFEKP